MKFFKERKLKIEILTVFSALICATVVCEIFYSTAANRKLILNFEKEYYSKNISDSTARYFNTYFERLELLLSIFSKHFNKNSVDKFQGYDTMFREGMKYSPCVISFYVALSDGSYVQLRKLDSLQSYQSDDQKSLPSYARYALRKITNQDGQLIETWSYLSEEFSIISKETLPNISYLPNKRDWYIQTEAEKGRLWSDAYIFSTTKLPGITLSQPIGYNDESNALGVICADITLRHFSDLLKNLKLSKNSESYLINQKNEIMASSTGLQSFTIDQDHNNLTLVKITQSDNLVLREAVKNLIGRDDEHGCFCINGTEYIASRKKLASLPFSLIFVSPQSDFTASFENVKHNMFLISCFIFLISFGVVFWIARRISTPISELCASAKSIGEMKLDGQTKIPSSNILEIQELSNAIDAMRLNVATFAKYAPKDLVRKLVKKGEEPVLGGRVKEITIFFSDIEKFSTVSEKLPAEYLVLHLSEYFDEITKEIAKHNGVIDKYIGDSVMAMWGAPNADENQVINACYAALGCQEVLEMLKEKWAPLGKPPLPTRIGLHTGQAIVGNIGSQDRMNFTAIGDSVNIASRLEGANKYYGTRILASESVESVAKGRILFRVIDKIAVKGRSSGITVYEPLCSMKNADEENYYKLIDLCAKSKESFELYQNQEFKKALKHYEGILNLYPQLAPSISSIMKRCEKFIENPPVNWDGINHLEGK